MLSSEKFDIALNIDDIKIDIDERSGAREISVYFLFFEERGIAIGRNGDYIRIVNLIFEKYVVFENKSCGVKTFSRILLSEGSLVLVNSKSFIISLHQNL